ncbi:N-acetyltransferase [Fusibacter paucivorans]|uniref:N-acetyltransferase n=1 Tax=Fusibacter paucivorans TaxID=76009 RepID=A0ABS5PN47_9FIRM|nr:GNAT family N-acetyltransferase [Fusibacter paucivorans]MBS7526297.1 N-acetyltransferase [Fusibacter paucivorans]
MIREVMASDLPAIKEIYNEAILNTTVVFDIEPKTDAVMQAWYQAHQDYHKIFVYDEGGKAVGFAALSRYREHQAFAATVELSIYVTKTLRGTGIGKKLMAHVIAYARQCEAIHTIVSVITSSNEGSIRFHLDFGFKHCGRIEGAGYKFGTYLGIDNLQLIV